jgi:site-specific recombinase XerD
MDKQITTTGALELFERALVGSNNSPKTIRAYTDDLKQFLDFLKETRVDFDKADQLSRIDIVEFLNKAASRGLSGLTRTRKLASIRKFYTLLYDSGFLKGNPATTVKGPVREEKDPTVLYKNEYKALLFEASNNPRDYAILQTFLQTGIRVGELVNLKIEDIDLTNKLLIVRQGKGKKDRTIPLESQGLDAISKYLEVRGKPDSEYLFLAKNGTSLDVRTVRYMVRKYVLKAGIHKKTSVHSLRHTYATHKIDKGMTLPNLQELLGHKKMETTYKYVHLAKTSLRQQQEDTAL